MELHREEKREEGERGGQEDKRGNQKERDPASNQFPKCSPQPGTHNEIHRVGQRRKGGEGRLRQPGGEKGESKGGESNQASDLIPK